MAYRIPYKLRVPSSARDSFNQSLPTYVDGATIWGTPAFKSGSEGIENEQEFVSRNFTIECNWHPDLNDDCQLTFDGRIFDITSIDNVDHRNSKLILTVTEEV